jgi:hypothetical protein
MDVATIDAFGKSSGIFAFMNTAWGWPFFESLHYLGLTVLLATVGLFDVRMLGFAKSIPLAAMHKFVPLGVVAYVVNIVTGFCFFVSAPDQYAFNPVFQLKVLCMLIAGINVVIFYTTSAQAIKALPTDANVPLVAKIIAATSLTSWLAVIVFGRLITYFRPPYHWCLWC